MAPRVALVMTLALASIFVGACDDVSQKKPKTDVVVHRDGGGLPLIPAPDMRREQTPHRTAPGVSR